jgi:hypothetical protein
VSAIYCDGPSGLDLSPDTQINISCTWYFSPKQVQKWTFNSLHPTCPLPHQNLFLLTWDPHYVSKFQTHPTSCSHPNFAISLIPILCPICQEILFNLPSTHSWFSCLQVPHPWTQPSMDQKYSGKKPIESVLIGSFSSCHHSLNITYQSISIEFTLH